MEQGSRRDMRDKIPAQDTHADGFGPGGQDVKETGVDAVGTSGASGADRVKSGKKRMSTSEYGAAARADDDRVDVESTGNGHDGKPDGVDADISEESVSGGLAGKMKDLVAKGRTGAAKAAANVSSSMGKAADKLNVPMKLLSVVSLVAGGSIVSLVLSLFLGGGNVGRYLPETDCRTDALPFEEKYTDNETMPSWSQDNMDSNAHTIYQLLSSKDFVQGVIDRGDYTIDSEVPESENWHYAVPKNLRNQVSVDASKASTSASLNDWISIEADPDGDSGEYISYNSGIGFTDEAILGMIAAAQAESGLNPQIWEGYAGCWYYDSNGTEIPIAKSSGGTAEKGGRDLLMATSHHRDWNGYVVALEKWWKEACGVTINLNAYKYTDSNNKTVAANGATNYYPGVGLWQWTGPRAYGLQEWANLQDSVSDSDLDGANDAMYGLNEQVYYALFENLNCFSGSTLEADGTARQIVNGDGSAGAGSGSLIDWGCMARAKYDKSYWANVPNKPAGTNTEKIGSRSRVRIPVANVSSGSPSYGRNYRHDDEVIMPVVDYVYDSSGRRDVDMTALDAVWSVLRDKAIGYNDSDVYMRSTVDEKIEAIMTDQYIPGSIPPTIYWHGFDELDMLDVGRSDGTNCWGPTMDSNGMDHMHGQNLSIYKTRVYYDVSVEVKATYSDGTVIRDMDGLSHSSGRPDGAAYGGTSGDGIIYESTFENMTGRVAAGFAGAGSGLEYNIFNDSGYGEQSLPNHDWVSASSSEMLSKMGRSGQWGGYGSDPKYGKVLPSEFPGWTDGKFHAWWSKDVSASGLHAVKAEGREYTDDYYRQKLARGSFTGGDGRNRASVNCIVTELDSDEESAEYLFCKEISDALNHWAESRALAQVARISAREFTSKWEGGTELDQLASHSDYGNLVHYAEMLVGNTWDRDDSVSSVLDMWHENIGGVGLIDWYNSFYHNYCGGGEMGFGGIAEMAVAMSWLQGHADEVKVNGVHTMDRWCGTGNYSSTYCTELYCAIKCIVGDNDVGNTRGDARAWESGSNAILYSSCDRGVCTSVRAAGADDNFAWGACVDQVAYVEAHPEKWERLGNASGMWDDLKPGDLLLSDHHVIVFVGPEYVCKKWPEITEAEAKYAICHSSYSGNLQNSRGLRCDPDGQACVNASGDFIAYRLVGEPDPQSVYKTRVEAEEAYLSTLWDGSL